MKRPLTTTRTLGAVIVGLVAALTLAACGSSGSGSSSGEFNDADVTFTQSMIPHHKQAVQMAAMARAHASSTPVKELATQIEAAQGPEIKKMQGWLEDWGQSKDSGSSMGGMGHGDGGMSGMPGMMSSDDMGALDKATGSSFDKMFLTMMIAHHAGAIDMAKTEQAKGKNADVKALAKDIEKAQTTEIAQMKRMLGS
jgi:uncharacterized protein (DUF305 family)